MDKAELTLADIGECLQSTVNLITTSHSNKVDIYLCCQASDPISCYPAQLNQVFMNLLVNACDATQDNQPDKPKGKIDILCHKVDENIEVQIKDNGCGMSEETITRIFEPFYTTKPVGKGTGLGLSISYGIIQKHQGQLKVSSTIGEGSEFRLILPCTTP
jgi:signal transduction histidine kinase